MNEIGIDDPLARLEYFTEAAGKKWPNLLRYSFDVFIENDLTGQRVLQIGMYSAKIACLFGLLGAQVDAIELQTDYLDAVQDDLLKFQIQDRVQFVTDGSNLDIFPESSFDLVFTKDALMSVPNLADFLEKVNSKLKPGGKVVFLENGRRHLLTGYLNKFQQRQLTNVPYFTRRELTLVHKNFEVIQIKRTSYPAIYLILGQKRNTAS